METVFASENDRKVRPEGGFVPLREYPLPAPTGCEGRGGKDKIQRNNNVLQKRVWILKMGTVAITGVYARGLFYKKRLNTTRAGRERKILCAWRAETLVSRFARGIPEKFLLFIPRASGTEFLSPSFVCLHSGRTPFSRPREQRGDEFQRNSTRSPP